MKYMKQSIKEFENNINTYDPESLSGLVKDSIKILKSSKETFHELKNQGAFKKFYGFISGNNGKLRRNLQLNQLDSQLYGIKMLQIMANKMNRANEYTALMSIKVNDIITNVENLSKEQNKLAINQKKLALVANELNMNIKSIQLDMKDFSNKINKMQQDIDILYWRVRATEPGLAENEWDKYNKLDLPIGLVKITMDFFKNSNDINDPSKENKEILFTVLRKFIEHKLKEKNQVFDETNLSPRSFCKMIYEIYGNPSFGKSIMQFFGLAEDKKEVFNELKEIRKLYNLGILNKNYGGYGFPSYILQMGKFENITEYLDNMEKQTVMYDFNKNMSWEDLANFIYIDIYYMYLLYMAHINFLQCKDIEGVKFLNKAITLKPKSLSAYKYKILYLLLVQDDIENSLKCYNDLVEKKFNPKSIYNIKSSIEFYSKRKEIATNKKVSIFKTKKNEFDFIHKLNFNASAGILI